MLDIVSLPMTFMDRDENDLTLDNIFVADNNNPKVSRIEHCTNTCNSSLCIELPKTLFDISEQMDCLPSTSNTTSTYHSASREKRVLPDTSSINGGHLEKRSKSYVSLSPFFILVLLIILFSYS